MIKIKLKNLTRRNNLLYIIIQNEKVHNGTCQQFFKDFNRFFVFF
jgi:hypothetical protein